MSQDNVPPVSPTTPFPGQPHPPPSSNGATHDYPSASAVPRAASQSAQHRDQAQDQDKEPFPRSPGRKRRKVTRSKAGCYTCRKRRKLCDMNRPFCNACTRLDMECTWPTPDELSRQKRPPTASGRYKGAGASASPATHPHQGSTNGHSLYHHPPYAYSSHANDSGSSSVHDHQQSHHHHHHHQPPLSHTHTHHPAAGHHSGTAAHLQDTAERGVGTPGSNTLDDFVGIFGNIGEERLELGMPAGAADPGTGRSLDGHGSLSGTGADSYQSLPTAGLGGGDDPLELGLMDWISGGGSLDEATLQLWAADCLAVPTTQTFNAFESLNSMLQPSPPPLDPFPPDGTAAFSDSNPADLPSSQPVGGGGGGAGSRRGSLSHSPPASRGAGGSSRNTPTGISQAAMLSYFHESLSRLVSCTGDSAPSAFEAFTKLANMTVGRGPAGQSLHLSILAWAARHMVNRGLVKYEAVGEKYCSQSTMLVDQRMAELFDSRGEERQKDESGQERDTEFMTLLAAALMLMQFKICRGDVWGFGTLVQHLTQLVPFVFRSDMGSQPDSMHHQFFENILYHDVLGSFILNRAPMVPEAIVNNYCHAGLETLRTLTGASLPIFSTMHRLCALVRQRRSRKNKGWSDEDLLDVVQPAMELEEVLADEKKRLDELVLAKPHIRSHRYLHEAFRTACLIQLRYHVLSEPPSSLQIRLLVRQALSLLEAMCDQNLPGMCSAHYVMFMAAICAVSGGQDGEEQDDRQRIDRIYDDFQQDFGFLNVERSRRIVHEVWSKNDGGRRHVDYLDVLNEYNWEMFIV